MSWSQRGKGVVQITEQNHHKNEQKEPSRIYRDSVRAMHYEVKRNELRNQTSTIRDRVRSLDLKREELLRIDGYYVDSDGNMVSPDELHTLQLADKQSIAVTFFNLTDFKSVKPEKHVDMVNSIGEQYVPLGMFYPNLDIDEGTVLRDKKIRHIDPALRRAEPRMYLEKVT